jgi:hypothetical protein
MPDANSTPTPVATLTYKDTNPKDAVGIKKVPLFSVVPWRVMAQIALAMLEGARKYGAGNYRVAGVRASVYADAFGRHFTAWWEGEDTDPDSGLSHIDKALASLTVLRDSMLQGNWIDDRPVKALGWMSVANAHAARIVETVRPNDPVQPYTELTHGSSSTLTERNGVGVNGTSVQTG